MRPNCKSSILHILIDPQRPDSNVSNLGHVSSGTSASSLLNIAFSVTKANSMRGVQGFLASMSVWWLTVRRASGLDVLDVDETRDLL